MRTKSQSVTENILMKCILLKFKTSTLQKHNYYYENENTSYSHEKNVRAHICDKELVFIIYKNFWKHKENNPIRKMQKTNRHYTKEDIETANNNTETCLTSLVVKEVCIRNQGTLLQIFTKG